MPLIRSEHFFDTDFTQIPNAWLRDQRLSLGAIGLLGQLLSHKPGWSISQESLAQANGCGRDLIRSLINELTAAGYLERSQERTRNGLGHMGGYTYRTTEPHNLVTMSDSPTLAQPTLGAPTLGKTTHKNTKEKNTNKKNTKETPQRIAKLIPEDFEPTAKDWELMATKFPWVDLKKQTHAFRDYWISCPPAKAKKTDWDATWRNWIRRSADYNKPEQPKAKRIFGIED